VATISRLPTLLAASARAAALALGVPSAANAATPGASALSAGSMIQVVLGLAVVLAMVLAAAWLLKRFSAVPGGGSGLIRIIGGAPVGQRERVILVEIAGTWLVLGVAPGAVRTLHTMPKSEFAPMAQVAAAADIGFAGWLRRIMDERKHA